MKSPEDEFKGKRVVDMIKSGQLRVDQPLSDPNLGTREILWNSIPEAHQVIMELEEENAEHSMANGREFFVSLWDYLFNLLDIFKAAVEQGRTETVDHFLSAYEEILAIDEDYIDIVMDEWAVKPVRRLGEQVKSRCGPLLRARAFPDDPQ